MPEELFDDELLDELVLDEDEELVDEEEELEVLLEPEFPPQALNNNKAEQPRLWARVLKFILLPAFKWQVSYIRLFNLLFGYSVYGLQAVQTQRLLVDPSAQPRFNFSSAQSESQPPVGGEIDISALCRRNRYEE